MVRLKTAVIVTPKIMGKNFVILWATIADITNVSPIELGRGGIPILAAAKTSHTMGNTLNMVFMPRLTIKVRVFVRS